MSVLQLLRSRLSQTHALSFAEYMHLALYSPYGGYYSSGLLKIGKEGDFITAPELTPLFGKCLANQCQQILATLENPIIFEYGAGTGSLCVSLLSHLQSLNALPEQYLILEVSPSLRQRQQDYIAQKIPELAARVQWLDAWPETSFNGVILANEVLDAMPVHRFLLTEEGVFESFVNLNLEGTLVEQFKPCHNPRLLQYIKQLDIKTTPYLSEVNLFVEDWILNNYALLLQGALILIDYGFPRHEYYHPDRNQGTIMCHYQHRTHSDPLLHPGEQDISAHVDFTQVAEAGQKAGFAITGYTNQASFLLSNGLLSLVETINNEREQISAKQAVKILTQPSEMGELFKVIALTKDLDMDLQGFQLHDKRVSL